MEPETGILQNVNFMQARAIYTYGIHRAIHFSHTFYVHGPVSEAHYKKKNLILHTNLH